MKALGTVAVIIALVAIFVPVTTMFYVVWASLALAMLIVVLGGDKFSPSIAMLIAIVNFAFIRANSIALEKWSVLISDNRDMFYRDVNITIILAFFLLMALIHCKPIDDRVAIA